MSKFTVSLSNVIEARITEIANRGGISEAVRRAMALFSIVEKGKGINLGIQRENPDSHEVEIVVRIVVL